MSKKKSGQRARLLDTLLEKGIIVAALGVGLLVAPLVLSGSPILSSVAAGMRMAAWPTLLIGLALLGFHFFVRGKGGGHTEAKPANNQPPPKTRQPRPGAIPHPVNTWSPAVFAAIEWRRFEAVCEALFAQAGFEPRSQSHGADGGVDIWLHSRNAKGPAAVVQCKNWLSKPVGVKEIREFLGVMSAHGLQRGTYATSGSYTADAAQFARDNGINALDGHGLLNLITRRTPEQQRALLEVAYEGEYWRPTCASCGIKMVERAPVKGGSPFWGCANFPRCRSTLQMRQTA